MKIRYYLFGEESCRMLEDEGIESLLSDDCLGYGCFKFIEGESDSLELVNAMNGWLEFSLISEEEYNIIKK